MELVIEKIISAFLIIVVVIVVTLMYYYVVAKLHSFFILNIAVSS